MFLNEVSLWQNIWQQTTWKLKVYSTGFITVLLIQLLFTFLTEGTGSTSYGTMYGTMQVTIYSVDTVITVSLMACFIVSMLMASKGVMQENASIVATRKTATLSTVMYLVILSAVATVTAASTFYIRLAVIQQMSTTPWLASDFTLAFKTYMLCFALHVAATAVGLFSGLIFSKSRLLFIVLAIAVVFIVPYMLYATITVSEGSASVERIEQAMNYYVASALLLLAAIVFYTLTLWIRSRQEVL